MAQVNNTPVTILTSGEWEVEGQPFGVIPKSFSYDGTNRVYLLTDNQVNIYSNTFVPVRSFAFTPTTCADESHICVTERCEANGTSVKVYYSYSDGPLLLLWDPNVSWTPNEDTYNVPANWTLTEISAYLSNYQNYNISSTSTDANGNITYLSNDEEDYYVYSKYAKQYPTRYWALVNNQLFLNYAYYEECNTYSTTWTEYSREEYVYNYNIGVGMFDYDDGEYQYLSGDNVGLLTQTLFNEDAQYEYIHFISGEYKRGYTDTPEFGCSQAEYESRIVYYHATCAGFEILSETGNSLCSITFPASFNVYLWYNTVNLIKLDGEYYLCVQGDISNEEKGILCYHIERNNSGASIQQVSAPMSIAAFPSPANRNQTITINLGGDNKTATEVQVINMNGQVLDRRTIPAGQQQTTLPASRLAPGTNLINATQNGQPIGTTRVIVK